MLTIIEGRVLGCLLEKERTTPDQYPLTLNALVLGCNQSTSREPVMHVADHEVEATLAALKSEGLLRFVHPAHGRSVTRYRQVADESWGLAPDAAAIVAVLLLRGPQTVAELRTRTERQHRFAAPGAVEDVLRELAVAGHVQLLERQPGHKEARWQQLFAEEAEQPATAFGPPTAGSMAERVVQLEARVARLELAFNDLLVKPIPPELAVESFISFNLPSSPEP
ncbi:MAG TPA: YceH family protein [Ilumatobacteraceae bacterium]|nr:YceH family protein [Ilumatobacteraceae bacterium]